MLLVVSGVTVAATDVITFQSRTVGENKGIWNMMSVFARPQRPLMRKFVTHRVCGASLRGLL